VGDNSRANPPLSGLQTRAVLADRGDDADATIAHIAGDRRASAT